MAIATGNGWADPILMALQAQPSVATHLTVLVVAMVLEASHGYPSGLYELIGHPVVWIGRFIDWLERELNRWPSHPVFGRISGVFALLLLAGLPFWLAVYVERLMAGQMIGLLLLALFSSVLLAARSLDEHVVAVAAALEKDGLVAGRKAVSMIVGRDPDRLDEAGVCRAAIESLAESFCDGVTAPVFWGAAGGLPGLLGYKAINTADSMIGHMSPRYRYFGWASARLDDAVNLPASRLAGLLLVLAAVFLPGASAAHAFKVMWRDAGQHKSPNAGWSEAALAGALGFKLAGPRVYDGLMVDDHFMGDGRADLTAADIRRALKLYRIAAGLLGLLTLLLLGGALLLAI